MSLKVRSSSSMMLASFASVAGTGLPEVTGRARDWLDQEKQEIKGV
jgi:hypothetical protein